MDGILVFGTLVVDRVRDIPSAPEPGAFMEYAPVGDFLGGEAGNTACALAKWGAPVTLVTNPIGDDTAGQFLIRELKARGVDVASVPVQNGPTPICDIYVDPSGERTMFGVNLDMESLPWPSREAHWMTVDPNLGPASWTVIREAKSRGLNAYAMDMPGVDGLELGDFVQLSRATVRAGECGDATLILTAGADPISVFTSTARYEVSAYPAPRLVDATGAGDCFRAGMLFGLASGWDIRASTDFACAAAALKIGTRGSSLGFPSLEEITHFQAQHPDRK
jgi:sugar/nucleoside kinase (ribokinase family)